MIFLRNWVVGRERSKNDYRNILEEQISQVNWGMPITYQKDQNPICEVNPHEGSLATNTSTCAINKCSKKNCHCTLHMHLVFLDPKS